MTTAFGWFKRSGSFSIEQAKSTLVRCPAGESLLQDAEEHEVEIRAVAKSELKRGALGQVMFENGEVVVLIRNAQPEARKVTTLAHELHHLRQFGSRQYIDALPDNEEAFVKNILDNEAGAETAANQVAFELSEIGITGPGLDKDRSEDGQWQQYSFLRRGGYSHESAAAFSEPLWDSENRVRQEYVRDARREWAETNGLEQARSSGGASPRDTSLRTVHSEDGRLVSPAPKPERELLAQRGNPEAQRRKHLASGLLKKLHHDLKTQRRGARSSAGAERGGREND